MSFKMTFEERRERAERILALYDGNAQRALEYALNVAYNEGREDGLQEAQGVRDEELGRWRWPENPDYVVYPELSTYRDELPVWVVNERTTERTLFTRSVATGQSEKHRAARAYFDAHPEPKPWYDAKPGEAWELTFGEHDRAEAYVVCWDGDEFIASCGEGFPITHPNITAGRRIWPEGD